MGVETAGTDNPADAERKLSQMGFQGTCIVAMNRETAGMSAGTGKPVKLQIGNKVIIKRWSNGIVFFDK